MLARHLSGGDCIAGGFLLPLCRLRRLPCWRSGARRWRAANCGAGEDRDELCSLNGLGFNPAIHLDLPDFGRSGSIRRHRGILTGAGASSGAASSPVTINSWQRISFEVVRSLSLSRNAAPTQETIADKPPSVHVQSWQFSGQGVQGTKFKTAHEPPSTSRRLTTVDGRSSHYVALPVKASPPLSATASGCRIR